MTNDPSPDIISDLIESFQSGRINSLELGRLVIEHSIANEGAITPDLDRQKRCGFPEVIYGEGKSTASIERVAERLLGQAEEVLVTRVSPEQVRPLSERFSFSRWNHVARTLRIGRSEQPVAPELLSSEASKGLCGMVAVVSAGTTDEPVAQEAMETLGWMGVPSILIQDVGVAGPYRLLAHVSKLRSMRAVVCVAGMEGALPSLLAGHIACPLIAVPTSVGYGANFAGLSALLSMLNSCAANIAVVNIDAGFKGGYLAGLIARQPQA